MRTKDEQKQTSIAESAIKIIVKDGFDGLSMHKLAKMAGVSPGTLYIYYQDRDDLIFNIAKDEEIKMMEATLKDFNPEMSFDVGLKKQWQNRAQYFLQNPLRMHFMEQIRYSRFHEQVSSCAKEQFSGTLMQFVKGAIDRNELVKLPLEVYWSLAFAPLYQLVKFHIHNKGLQNRPFQLDEAKLDLTLSLVLKALKP